MAEAYGGVAVEGEHPCEKCKVRKGYARRFNIHFWGDDCPYECKKLKGFVEKGRRINGREEEARE